MNVKRTGEIDRAFNILLSQAIDSADKRMNKEFISVDGRFVEKNQSKILYENEDIIIIRKHRI